MSMRLVAVLQYAWNYCHERIFSRPFQADRTISSFSIEKYKELISYVVKPATRF